MCNVVIPSMGGNVFFEESYFPKMLVEIGGRTMLETVLENFTSVFDRQMIYIFGRDECNQFHVDDSVKVLDAESKIIRLKGGTAGALCTALMAIPYINNEIPLIIANSDQVIDVDYAVVMDYFMTNRFDGGVITFPSIHPRWSYARIEKDHVVEVAEKRPFSNHAIAGFYFFREGRDFVRAAERAMLKESCVGGKYYISASINEMILMDKGIGFYEIKKEQYHSFYSPDKITEYERSEHIW